MPITVNDIQLLESERLTDEDNGGGRMTGAVVDSGEVNNLFPDISRLDRTYGRLSLRKAYMAVRSLNTDVYLGAHVIVTDPPDDARVSTTLFTTDSPVDERLAAQNRIESYVTRGPLSPYYLFGTQPQGAKAIALFGRTETPLPEVGDVLVLSEEDAAGVVANEQYVRVADVDFEERTFTDGASLGEYIRKVVTVTLTSELRRTFVGIEATRYSNASSPTLVRTTTVADASRYYGVTRLAAPAAQDALSITVENVFSQLVPSTTREVPFAGARPGQVLNFVAIGAARNDGFSTGDGAVYVKRGVLPRSITSGDTNGGTDFGADDGTGNLMNGSVDVGDVDYESGRLVMAGSDDIRAVGYTPAVAVQRSSYTVAREVTLATQGTVYVQPLLVAPAPKTVRVDYRYLGKWYTLTDAKGDGTLQGASAGEGGGTVDYATGDVVVTLGALPDIGSRVIFSAGQRVDFTQRTGASVATSPMVDAQLQQPADAAAGASFSWISGGLTKSATADAAGALSGDATGTLSYANGNLTFAPAANAWPDSNSTLAVDYTAAVADSGTVLGSYSAGTLQFSLPAGALPLKAGGMVATIPLMVQSNKTDLVLVKDDGAGSIVAPATWNDGVDNLFRSAIVGGTVDYQTGIVTVQIGPVSIPRPAPYVTSASSYVMGYKRETISGMPDLAAAPAIRYWGTSTAVASQPVSEEIAFPGILINLVDGYTDSIVPGSVWFAWGGKDYIDRQGKILRDFDYKTGSAAEAGTINYQTGEVLLTDWGTTTGGAVNITTMLTEVGRLPISYLVFRTPGAPIRPASLYLQAVRSDTGALITGTSTTNGPISSAYMEGTADHNMGWVEARFGEYVPAAGNENEPWYHTDNVVGSNVFKPIPVDPNSIEFNCVVLTNLPLDADLLGIDPVRLPQTGKVPIVRDGDVVVVHEARTHTLPSPISAGQVVALPDAPVSQVALVDANGADVPLAQYTADLTAGTVAMADPMDLTGLVEPLIAEYVVEDMVLVSSVGLSGEISLVGPLSRDYASGAWVSSALLYGDLRAANPVFFSQQTWQGEYLDERDGSNTTAQYNRTLYPLELVNANAVTERWALIFTSSVGGSIVGETLGVIGTFDTSTNVQPVNPVTGQPYFILRATGFGAGWSVNNVIRFNTVGPNAPIWIARTVLPGAQALADDAFRLQLRGDAD